jgi:hypothetical protein
VDSIAATSGGGVLEAAFALAGTVVGILGTLGAEATRARSEDKRSRRDLVRLACADFTAAVTRTRTLAFKLREDPADRSLYDRMRQADEEARVYYERLRLVTTSRKAQEAGRRALRYAFGLQLRAQALPPREDERDRGPLALLHDSMVDLFAEIRRETGIPNPDDLYREPEEWLRFSSITKS